MNITINRGSLIRTINQVASFSSGAAIKLIAREDHVEVVSAIIQERGHLKLFAGMLVVKHYDVTIQEQGECIISPRLSGILVASADDFINLSVSKQVVIKGDSGFSARMSQATDIYIPDDAYDRLYPGTDSELDLAKESLVRTIKASSTLDGFGPDQQRWVEVISNAFSVVSSVQPSELGTIENIPLNGTINEGESATFVVTTELINGLLKLCGDVVRIRVGQGSSIMIFDPDNPNWWAAIAQIIKPQGAR